MQRILKSATKALPTQSYVDFGQCCHVERSETSLIIFCEIVALKKQPEILRFAQNDTREANAKSGFQRLCFAATATATRGEVRVWEEVLSECSETRS
jgi:hypothetical protein